MSQKSLKGGFVKFMAGRGFYAALAVCLVGTGAAAWVTVDRTLTGIEQNNQKIIDNLQSSSQADEEERTWGFPTTEEANKPESGITASSPPSSSQSTQQSSSEQASGSQEQLSEVDGQPSSLNMAYVLPINGQIINQYSHGKLVKDITLGEWRTHNGVDIASTGGTAVHAAGAGTVSSVYSDALWGYTVELSHGDGLVSVYSGLDKDIFVKSGDSVKLGQELGVLGNVPVESSLQQHLHFAMKRDGAWIDPLSLIQIAG